MLLFQFYALCCSISGSSHGSEPHQGQHSQMLVASPSPPFVTHRGTGAAVQPVAVTCHTHNSSYRDSTQPSLAGQVLPRIRDAALAAHPSQCIQLGLAWVGEESSHLNPARSTVCARPNNRSAPTSLSTAQPLGTSPESLSSLNRRERRRESCDESKSIQPRWSLDLQGTGNLGSRQNAHM